MIIQMSEEQLKSFLGGFILCGVRSKDGRLTSLLGEESIDDWPQEVYLCGNIYTLENITKFGEGNEEADYA